MRLCASKIKYQIITLYTPQISSHFILINKRNLNIIIDIIFIYLIFNIKRKLIANIKIVFFYKNKFYIINQLLYIINDIDY